MRRKFLYAFCAALALTGCAGTAVNDKHSTPAPAEPRQAAVTTLPPTELFERAANLLLQHDAAGAKTALRQLVSGMPAQWRPVGEAEKSVAIAYWDQADFLECSIQEATQYKKDIIWTTPSYAHAWYLLAFIAIEEKDAKQAEASIDQALALEPDRALMLNEKATILQEAGRFEEAAGLNRKAIASQRCVSAATRKTDLSRAWRSLGVSLIELRRWDEADTALAESLKVDPGNRHTLAELVYLEKMRGKHPPTPSAVGIHRTNE